MSAAKRCLTKDVHLDFVWMSNDFSTPNSVRSLEPLGSRKKISHIFLSCYCNKYCLAEIVEYWFGWEKSNV